jgi:hypothetical protein
VTTLTVLYTRRTSHPLGALTTAVPGDPPSLDPSATVRLSLPLDLAQKVPPTSPPPAAAVRPQPVALTSGEVAIAVVEAEFDDPAQIFEWRVVTTTAPDGTLQHRLDRLVTVQVGADLDTAAKQLRLRVPRLGNADRLQFEVRELSGVVGSGVLVYPTTAAQSTTIVVPGQSPPVVLVEGYPAAVARADGNDPG